MSCTLLAWFRSHRRRLPWRDPEHRADPYRVLVAEIMLQQTRVDTAAPYYRRWLERFPDIDSLAAASTDDVLRLWQGLGYYRRALRLRDAARVVVARHGGVVPATRQALEELPGVGRYTAAAVTALAYGTDAIAVDGNVRRLAARLHGWTTPPADAEIERSLAVRLACRPRSDAPLAEALIELGALVCTAREPACDRCPLISGCAAAASGSPERFPRLRRRPATPRRKRWALVLVEDDAVWLRRRGEDEMLPGLWGFPQVDAPPADARCLLGVHHAYSHFRLELVPAIVQRARPDRSAGVAGDVATSLPTDARRHRLADVDRLALSTVDLRVLERLQQEGVLGTAAVS